MSHVDDGRLHAYLDGALPEGAAERRELEDHLGDCPDCRERLEAARRDREGSGEILALLDPEEIRVPPFEELLARRGGGRAPLPGADAPRPGSGSAAPRPRSGARLRRLALAASLILAVGGGWVARDLFESTSPTWGAQGASSRFEGTEGDDAPPPPASTPGAVASEPSPLRGDATAAVSSPTEPAPSPESELSRERASSADESSRPIPEADAVQERRAEVAAESPEVAAEAREPAAAAPELPEDVVRMRDQLGAARGLADFLDRAPSPGRPLWEMAVQAEEEGRWQEASPARAADALGRIPLELEGFPWSVMEVAEVEGISLVRTLHPLETGERVELLQVVTPPRSTAPARAVLGGETAISVEREGRLLLLRGPVEPERLSALLERIR